MEVHKSQYGNNLWYHAVAAGSAVCEDRTWAHNTIGTPQASDEWLLAEGCTAGGFETWVLLQNPGDTDANVDITYMTGDCEVPGPQATIEAGTRATFNVADTMGSPWEVASRITSDQPVVTERSVYGFSLSP
ncbi:MAG: hypothetical protein SWK76_16020 [Actinomycetota bacterium]|nr:hypothetical protein [Actinomycetota bacterium]